MSKDNQI